MFLFMEQAIGENFQHIGPVALKVLADMLQAKEFRAGYPAVRTAGGDFTPGRRPPFHCEARHADALTCSKLQIPGAAEICRARRISE